MTWPGAGRRGVGARSRGLRALRRLALYPHRSYWLDVKRDPDSGDEQLVLSIGIERDPAPHRPITLQFGEGIVLT